MPDNRHIGRPRLHALHKPRIELDERQCHPIGAFGQLECFFDITLLPLNVETAANIAVLATCLDLTAVPALEIVVVVKIICYW